jgi:ribosome maturation factor RimP
MKKAISPALLAVIDETVKSCDVELYDVEFKGRFLRVSIYNSSGITVDICAKVSQKLSERLDMENLITDRYFLAVSSPGIERKLRNFKDFQETISQTVSVSTRSGSFKGKVLSVNENGVIISNIKGSSGKADTEQNILYCDINYARIIVSDEELFSNNTKPRTSSAEADYDRRRRINTDVTEKEKLIKAG